MSKTYLTIIRKHDGALRCGKQLYLKSSVYSTETSVQSFDLKKLLDSVITLTEYYLVSVCLALWLSLGDSLLSSLSL